MEIFVRRPVLAVVISLAFLLVGAYAADCRCGRGR